MSDQTNPADNTASSSSDAKPQASALVLRLSIMMFLQFFIWGAWYVSMDGFLSEAGMKQDNNGLSFHSAAYTVAPIAAILAPLTLGLIADRLMNTERVLAILNLVGAGLLYYAPSLASAGTPDTYLGQFAHPFVLCLLGYMLCFMPTLGLTASLSFAHLSNGEKQFPVVRVLGTIGWIVGNWAMWGGRLFTGQSSEMESAKATLATALEAAGDNRDAIDAAHAQFYEVISFGDNSPYMFTAAAIASALLGLYCLTLPRTTPPAKGQPISIGKIFGVDAWAMMKNPAFCVFAIASFLICIPLAGYYAQGYGFVSGMGVTLFGSTTGAMSTGQMSEIFFMLIMPLCFARLGAKWMLGIGMLAWGLRYALWGGAFGLAEGPALTATVFAGILLHGICYDFFFVTGMIYTDKKAPEAVKGQAQSLIVMLTQGLGLGLGAQLFGWWASKCTTDEVLDFSTFWYYPAGFAVAVMLVFLVSFWDKEEKIIEV